MLRKIIPSFLAFATVLSLICPVYAVDSSKNNAVKSDLWSMILEKSATSSTGFGRSLFNNISCEGDTVCPSRSGGAFHGGSGVSGSFSGSDRSGLVKSTCDYCGKTFAAKVTSDQFSDAYTSSVSSLPANGYIQTVGSIGIQRSVMSVSFKFTPPFQAILDCLLLRLSFLWISLRLPVSVMRSSCRCHLPVLCGVFPSMTVRFLFHIWGFRASVLLPAFPVLTGWCPP